MISPLCSPTRKAGVKTQRVHAGLPARLRRFAAVLAAFAISASTLASPALADPQNPSPTPAPSSSPGPVDIAQAEAEQKSDTVVAYIQSEKPSDDLSAAETDEIRSRESDNVPTFPFISDEESIQSGRASTARVIVDAGSLKPPPDATPEQLEWLQDPNDGPGYYDAGDDSDPPPGPDKEMRRR